MRSPKWAGIVGYRHGFYEQVQFWGLGPTGKKASLPTDSEQNLTRMHLVFSESSRQSVWFLLQSKDLPAAENMAWDEALLDATLRVAQPVLRFYGWSQPAATFGYSQKYQWAARMTSLRPLVRRTTGGGLVEHRADWTYSLVLPPTHHWYELPAAQSYQRVHRWLSDAFSSLQIETETAAVRQGDGAGKCFAAAEQFDLLWKGTKIAGAAHRRSRHGLLVQGSVQPPSDSVGRVQWQEALCRVASQQWKTSWLPLDVGPELNESVRRLTLEKYSQPAYNERR